MKISNTDTFKKSSNLEWKQIGDEALILNPDSMKFYQLNSTATFFWVLINGKRTFDNIVNEVINEFKIPENKARADMKKSFSQFFSKGLIQKVKKK